MASCRSSGGGGGSSGSLQPYCRTLTRWGSLPIHWRCVSAVSGEMPAAGNSSTAACRGKLAVCSRQAELERARERAAVQICLHRTPYPTPSAGAHLLQLLAGQLPLVLLPLISILVVLGVKGQQEGLRRRRRAKRRGMAAAGGKGRASAGEHVQPPVMTDVCFSTANSETDNSFRACMHQASQTQPTFMEQLVSPSEGSSIEYRSFTAAASLALVRSTWEAESTKWFLH